MSRAPGSNRETRFPIAASISLAAVWFWAGISVALSGIETPVRTRMAEIPEQHYLAIGYRLFHVVNSVEWFLGMVVLAGLLAASRNHRKLRVPFLLASGLIIVLLTQTVLLYGPLDARTLRRLDGLTVPDHPYHWFYIAAEVVKFIALVAIGTLLIRQLKIRGGFVEPVATKATEIQATETEPKSGAVPEA